jgi:hypothetical protein
VPELIKRKPSRRRRFLEELAKGWSVSKAAQTAGVSRAQIYRWRTEDPQFATDWNEAYEVGVDALEDAAYSRAVEGVATPIFDKQAKQVGKKVEYSDRLLELLLKSKRPRVYVRQENSFNQTVNVTMPTLADMRKKYLELGLTPPTFEGDFAEVKDDAGT